MSGRKGRSGGRNAKSTKQLRLEGTLNKARHGRKRQPTPRTGDPKSPATLDGAGLREWTRMVKMLKASELLTVVDGAMLYQYCELHADALDIRALLRKLKTRAAGRLDARDRDELEKRQLKLWAQGRAYRQAIRLYLVEFGLSPSARSRVDLDSGGAGAVGDDEFDEFDHPPVPLALLKGGKK